MEWKENDCLWAFWKIFVELSEDEDSDSNSINPLSKNNKMSTLKKNSIFNYKSHTKY